MPSPGKPYARPIILIFLMAGVEAFQLGLRNHLGTFRKYPPKKVTAVRVADKRNDSSRPPERAIGRIDLCVHSSPPHSGVNRGETGEWR